MFTLIRNYREFSAGLIGLLLVLGVIIGFGAAGWPGEINTCYKNPGNCYCENIDQKNPEKSSILRNPGLFAQPVNTWTNVGFMFVGLLTLWWIGWERTTGRRSPYHNRISDGTLFASLYGGFTVFLGPGSMFFHASMRLWAGWFDVMSMNFFLAFVPAYNAVRRFQWPQWAGILIYAALVVFESIANYVDWFLSWTNGPLCDPNSPFQGHGVWLLLSAAAVGCLYKYFRAEEGTQTT